jgi:hypothetical protein
MKQKETKNHYRFIDTWGSTKALSGNLLSYNFINNPQYKLTLNTKTHLQLKLETAIAAPIMLSVMEKGEHSSRLDLDYIVNNKNPGFFFNSFSYFECVLEKGSYTIACVCQDEKVVKIYLFI